MAKTTVVKKKLNDLKVSSIDALLEGRNGWFCIADAHAMCMRTAVVRMQ